MANFFALNPLAFWKRSEAVRHGFESVRETIESNYDQLSEVIEHYGLEMSRSAALEKAEAVRDERGWDPSTEESVEEDARLRLVGT